VRPGNAPPVDFPPTCRKDGDRPPRLRRARAGLLAGQENGLAVVVTLVADVTQTYFDLTELDREIDIARRTRSWICAGPRRR